VTRHFFILLITKIPCTIAHARAFLRLPEKQHYQNNIYPSSITNQPFIHHQKMQPFVNLLHRATAHVRSFSNPTPPESPSTITTPGENAGTDVADTTTPTQPQDLTNPPDGEPAGINADTAPPLPHTPENRRDVMQTDDAASDTTIVAADDVETASERRRRKRREKEARQRQRRSGGGDGTPGREREEEDEGVSGQRQALAGSGGGAVVNEGGGGAGGGDGGNERRGEDEDVSLGGGALPGSGNGAVLNEEGSPRVESRGEVGDARVDPSNQIKTLKADDDGKATRLVVQELEVGEEEEDDRDGKNTASDFEPQRNERDATHSEPQLVDPPTSNKTEHDELVKPTLPEPQVVDSPSTSEPERTKHDPRRSAQRLLAASTNKKSPSQTTIPTIKQLYPKHGLGPAIKPPSKPQHRFTIDSLNPPLPPTTTQPSAPSQPCPNLPESLKALQAADLADSLRAAHMSILVHNVLADRLWRTVQFANYFYTPPARNPAIVVRLPPTFHSMSPRQQRLARLAARPPPPPHYRAAVEEGVASFLSRTRKIDAEYREMNKFTRANRDMAGYLQTSLALERVVTKREMFEMFEASYGKGGEEGVD